MSLILVWSSSLQLKAILVNSEVSRLEGQISAHTNEYRGILDNQNKTADIKHKLEALRRLSANRLLNGTLLNALQQTTVDDVQLLRLRVDQTLRQRSREPSLTPTTTMSSSPASPPRAPRRSCSRSKAPTPPPTPATS